MGWRDTSDIDWREICCFSLIQFRSEESFTVPLTGPDFDLTPTPDEVESVASLLEGTHGDLAADVADFIATQHSLEGDAARSWAWTNVVDRIRERERERLHQSWHF